MATLGYNQFQGHPLRMLGSYSTEMAGNYVGRRHGKTSKVAVGYLYCNKPFTLEKKCNDQKTKYRREFRQNIILPVLEEYFCLLDTLDPEKGSKLEDAAQYSRNQKRQLTAFLGHGDVPISTNLAENAIPPSSCTGKTGCSAIQSREQSPVRLCILW